MLVGSVPGLQRPNGAAGKVFHIPSLRIPPASTYPGIIIIFPAPFHLGLLLIIPTAGSSWNIILTYFNICLLEIIRE